MPAQEALDRHISPLDFLIHFQGSPSRLSDARGEFERSLPISDEHIPLIVRLVLIELHNDHIGAPLLHPRGKSRDK